MPNQYTTSTGKIITAASHEAACAIADEYGLGAVPKEHAVVPNWTDEPFSKHVRHSAAVRKKRRAAR